MVTAHLTWSWSPWAGSSQTLWNNAKLLTSSGHGPHRGTPTYDGRNRDSQQQTGPPYIDLGDSAMTTTTKGRSHNRTVIQTATVKHPSGTMTTNKAVGLVIKATFWEGITPGSMKLGLVVNVTQSAQSCQTLSSAWRRRLHLWQPHQKTKLPLSGCEYVPEPFRGSDPSEEIIRHSYSSQINTPTLSSETEIVHIGRKSQNKCAIITVIGERSQKALWDLGAGRCIISYDCYNSLQPKYKMELFPSSVKIRVANGTFIPNKGECDVTVNINKERFTFPFLCLDQLSQQMILGHISLRHIALACFGMQMMWWPLLEIGCHSVRCCLPMILTHWCFVWNLLCYSLTSMGILGVGYPGQKENHTWARVVCLNIHSNTHLNTHTVIHM